MIDLLVFIETLIEVGLAGWWRPEYVPLVGLRVWKTIDFKHWTDKFVVKAQHLIEDFRILNMIWLLVALELLGMADYLVLCDVFESNEITLVFILIIISSWWSWSWILWGEEASLWGGGCLVKWGCGGLSSWWVTYLVFLKVFELEKDLGQLSLALLLFIVTLRYMENSLFIYKIWSTWKII
jgi:hypothetical protein